MSGHKPLPVKRVKIRRRRPMMMLLLLVVVALLLFRVDWMLQSYVHSQNGWQFVVGVIFLICVTVLVLLCLLPLAFINRRVRLIIGDDGLVLFVGPMAKTFIPWHLVTKIAIITPSGRRRYAESFLAIRTSGDSPKVTWVERRYLGQVQEEFGTFDHMLNLTYLEADPAYIEDAIRAHVPNGVMPA